MKVVYDHQIFAFQRFGGVSRYFTELIVHLSDASSGRVVPQIVAPLYINEYLCERKDKLEIHGRHIKQIPHTGRILRVANDALSRHSGVIRSADIIHETYYGKGVLGPANVKRVVTVYDMIHELFPDQFPVNDNTGQRKLSAVLRADHVICISKNTQKDLVEITGIPLEKTSVIHLGFELNASASDARTPLDKPYFLYVGARGGYKNFAGLVRAYASSTALKEHFSLIAFGGSGFSRSEKLLFSELGLTTEHVIHIAGGDGVLRDLYSAAEAFVYPSLYEGFGIPPLEAMSLECPVICSNTSSIPEVVNNAAVYFDPYDIGSIMDALERVSLSAALRGQLIEAGNARVRDFSWQSCALETFKRYETLAG